MLLHNHTYFSDKRELSTLARVAGTDEGRPGIIGVWFDPGADGCGRAWATDGHAAALIDRDGRSRGANPVPVLASELAGVCKLARPTDVIALRVGKPNGTRPKRVGWSIMPGRFEAGALVDALKSGDLSLRDAVASGHVATVPDVMPPAIDQVIPNYESHPRETAGRIALNPGLLAPFLADAAKLERLRAVRVWMAGELDPLLVMFTDGNRDTVWRYVAMPMRM